MPITNWQEKENCHTANERLVTAFGKEQLVSPQHGAGQPGNAAAGFSAHPFEGPFFAPRLAGPDWGCSTRPRRPALVSAAVSEARSHLAIIDIN